jgi:hypothetical protein
VVDNRNRQQQGFLFGCGFCRRLIVTSGDVCFSGCFGSWCFGCFGGGREGSADGEGFWIWLFWSWCLAVAGKNQPAVAEIFLEFGIEGERRSIDR